MSCNWGETTSRINGLRRWAREDSGVEEQTGRLVGLRFAVASKPADGLEVFCSFLTFFSVDEVFWREPGAEERQRLKKRLAREAAYACRL